MIAGGLKKVLLYAAEALVAIALVLVFFFVSMTVLEMTFPKGAGLGELMGGSRWSGNDGATSRFTIDRNNGPRGTTPAIVARLVDVQDRVKDKPSDRISWDDSRSGAALEERHAVQTFTRSSAVIAFEGRGRVTLQQNSLVVLGAAESKEQEARGEVSLLITSGAVRGIVQGTQGSVSDFRVQSLSGEARLGGAAPSTDFQVSVNPDHSSTFTVYAGATEITAAGHTVTLGAHQAVTVAPGAAPGEPIDLPKQPEPVAPRADALVTCRRLRPLVSFSWRPVPEATQYHVQLGRDAEFKRLVDDDRIAGTVFDYGNLPPGNYFWRVSAMRGNAEGESSAPRRLTIVEDLVPPLLELGPPEAKAGESKIVVRGDTEPGARVFIGSARVATDPAGRFTQEVELTPGWNLVVIEAIDPAGNAAYQSQRVMSNALPQARLP